MVVLDPEQTSVLTLHRWVCLQEGEPASDSNGSKSRAVVEAKLQVTTTDAQAQKSGGSSIAPGAGVLGSMTAAMGALRQSANGNTPLLQPHSSGGPPQLKGLPPSAALSNITRLTGVTSGIVSRPRQSSREAQFKQQLGSRSLLREPSVVRSPATAVALRPSGLREVAKAS